MTRALHKMRPKSPAIILLSDVGNVSSTAGTSHTFTSVAVGSGPDRTIIIMATLEDETSTDGDITVCNVDGNATVRQVGMVFGSGGKVDTAVIFSLKLTTETGNVNIVLISNRNVDSWGLSFIIVTGLLSATPTDTATGSASSTSVATSTTLDGLPGGIAVGVTSHDGRANAHTWGSSLTERTDLQTGGDTVDHRHSVGYDLLPIGRGAATETVTSTGSGRFALATASFR